MLFNSSSFAIFFTIVFLPYYLVFNKSSKTQNLLLLLANYIFYALWDWRFLSLIIFITLINYLFGLVLEKSQKTQTKKVVLIISLILNLIPLFFFKYFNFFTESFISLFNLFGVSPSFNTFKIILPIGISFYTLQAMTYPIDIYRGKIKATRDFISFASFISFFPQILSGPIEKAKNLLPQFQKKREFNYTQAVEGLQQILWGLFKKVVIADNLAHVVGIVFTNPSDHSGLSLLIGAVFFSFQIYADFSGYSDMAIGLARLLGFDFHQNFRFPYFSQNIAEFWRRWHISLTTWFRDYIYIPLGGSREGALKTIFNVFLVFLLSALWHGAGWSFVIWGLLHFLYYLPSIFFQKNKNKLEKSNLSKVFSIITTFSLTTFAWIFFRADSLKDAWVFISRIFSIDFFTFQNFVDINQLIFLPLLIIILVLIDWQGRQEDHPLKRISLIKSSFLRKLIYFSIALSILVLGNFGVNQFIYFQF